MNKTLALLLSYIAHPGLMPILGITTVLLLSPHYISQSLFIIIILYTFLGTYLFPFITVIVLQRFGLIKSLYMANAAERRLPFLAAGLFYLITAQSLRQFPLPVVIPQYLFAGVLILGVSLMLLNYIKISIHAAGMGALTALVLFLSQVYLMQLLLILALIVLLSGFVASARLYLRAHKPVEVYTGYGLGMSSAFLSFIWFA